MPSLQLLCFFTSIGFLFGCHMNKDSHPTNLYCLAGFTVRRPGQPPPTASSLKPPPLPPPSPLPPTSHLSPPPPLALLPRLHQALREDAPTPTPPQPTTHHPPTPNHTPNHTPAVVDRDKHRHRLRHLPGPRPRLHRAAGITYMSRALHVHTAGPPTSVHCTHTAHTLHALGLAALLTVTLLTMTGPRPHRLGHLRSHRLYASLQA